MSFVRVGFPGQLALSRALGDFKFKTNNKLPAEEQMITANPELTCRDISEEDEFLVLASDGMMFPHRPQFSLPSCLISFVDECTVCVGF
jgi:hypothetical protein